MNNKTILTQEGLTKLELELENLKSVKRREVADKIKVALSFGDLSENSEYDEAKNEQGLVEARIAEIEAKLKNVEIIDTENLNTENVQVGNKVKVRSLTDNKEISFSIVGTNEVDIRQGKISDESPIGKALINHRRGDVFDVTAPSGTKQYEVLDITK